MAERAFVDSNLLIYLSGRAHPLKQPCVDLYREIGRDPSHCWTSAEVLQEILHVFLRRGYEQRAETVLNDFAAILAGHIAPLVADDVLWCLGRSFPAQLQARDRVHLAVMSRLGISRVISADVAFDAVDGIERLAPERLVTWRDSVFAV
jgi:predicted nucleic acid-binding protein